MLLEYPAALANRIILAARSAVNKASLIMLYLYGHPGLRDIALAAQIGCCNILIVLIARGFTVKYGAVSSETYLFDIFIIIFDLFDLFI